MPTKPLKYMSNTYQGPSHITEDDPNAIEFSNAAYDRMFSEEAGYPQRDPNAPSIEPYRPPPPDVRGFINTGLKALGDHYEGLFSAARDPREKAAIQQQYDREKFEENQKLAQIEHIQGLMDSGLSVEAGLRAQQQVAGINVPAEPTPPRTATPSATGMSLSQQMGDVGRLTEIMAEQILHDPFWRGGGEILKDKATAKTKMETLFVNFWDAQNLSDPRMIHKREGFVQSFVMAAGNNVHTAKLIKELLDKKTGSVEMRRRISGGNPIIDGFNGKFSDTKPGVSPIAKSVWRLRTAKKSSLRPAMVGAAWAPSQAFNMRKPETEAVAPKRQTSPSTGRTRISYDGGKTWQNE